MKKTCGFIILLFIISSWYYSCNNSSNDALYEFDPRLLNENKVTLSEIADDISYIPLDNAFPTGRITKIVFTKDAIYTNPREIGIIKYSRNGKFVTKIGSIGRGPGEYVLYMKYCVDEESGTVYVSDLSNTIKVFTNNGDFSRSFMIKDNASIMSIEFFNSKIFVKCGIETEGSEFEWIVCDTMGNIIKKQSRHLPKFATNYGNTVDYPYLFDNKLSYFNTWLDTVFTVSPNLSEKPSFTLASGDFRWPKSILTTEQIMQNRDKYFGPDRIFESNHYIIIRYSYINKYIAFINKDTHETFLTRYEYDGLGGASTNGIPNDLDAGLSFFPEIFFTEKDREYLIGWQYPYQLRTHLKKDEFIKSNPKDINKKKEFENLVSQLHETDNQVLIIVRLKK